MKAISVSLATAILFSVGSLASIVYADSDEEPAAEKSGHHEHGEGGHGGGHMGHMNDVLQTLQRELGDKYDQPVPAATEEQLASGKETFSKLCVACHGESGKGDGPAAAALEQKPADFTDPEHSKVYSDMGRMQIIRKGVAGTPMTAWGSVLSEQEIQAVHAYVRSLRAPASKQKHGHGEHSH